MPQTSSLYETNLLSEWQNWYSETINEIKKRNNPNLKTRKNLLNDHKWMFTTMKNKLNKVILRDFHYFIHIF